MVKLKLATGYNRDVMVIILLGSFGSLSTLNYCINLRFMLQKFIGIFFFKIFVLTYIPLRFILALIISNLPHPALGKLRKNKFMVNR